MKLGEACFLKSGKNITAKEIYVSPKDNLYPCYGGNGLRGYVDKYNYEGDYNLIGRQGALCGNINRVNGKFYATEHAVVVTPLISLDIDWLYFALVGMDLNQYHTGAAQPGLNIDILNNLEIDVPIIGEQIAQATVLNKINGMIRNRKRELEKLDDLIKARFVELFGSISNNKFGYEVMTLQDVCEPIKDGTHQTPTYTEDTVNGYKFLSSKDVTSGKVDWNHLKYIPEELHKELYKRISPRKGDILLAKNGTTGVAAIVDRDDVFDIYVSLALLRPLGMVTSEYLCSAVNSIETKHQFDSSLKGIGVPNLHLGEIKKTKIVVPPIEAQEQFADFVKQVDKSKAEVQKSLDEAQLLFDSLMQQYFG